MLPPVNIKKSIKSRKIVLYKEPLWLSIFDNLTRKFLIFSPLFIFFFIAFIESNTVLSRVVLIIVTLSLLIFLFLIVSKSKELKEFEAKKKHNNKYQVLDYVNSKNWNIITNRNNFIKVQLQDSESGIYWKRFVFIFFHKTNILVNCSTMDNYSFVVPLHWFGNRKIEKDFINEFKIDEK